MSNISSFTFKKIDIVDEGTNDLVNHYIQVAPPFVTNGETSGISEQILLCPGPVMVSKRVKQSLMHTDIGHRENEFVELLTRIRKKLNVVFDVDSLNYTSVVLTGSGTTANESLLSSYGPDKKIAILTNGEFGDRLVDIAKCHKVNVIPVDFGWGNPIDIEYVKNIIEKTKIDAVMMVHHETSSGMLNPIYLIGELLNELKVDFLVDAVSSIGAEELSVEKAKITFCTASANKALASLPGLSFICGKKAAFEALKGTPARTRYLDLYNIYQFEELKQQTPNTPAVSLFFALETALDELLSDSIVKRIQRYGKFASIIRARLKNLGMSFVIPEKYMSRVLTTVYYPEDWDVEGFHRYLKEQNFVVYRGKGPYFEKAFQIANIGHITEQHLIRFLDLLEGVIHSQNLQITGSR